MTAIAGVGLFAVAFLSGMALIVSQPDRVAKTRGIASAASVTERAAATSNRVAAAWRPDLRAAREFIERRSGWTSFAIVTKGFSRSVRGRIDVPLASTVKVILMAAVLRGATGRDLTAPESALLTGMIRNSDNDAATSMLGLTGLESLDETAKRAGAGGFEPDYAWGLSRASAVQMARFMWRLPSILPDRHRRLAMEHLESVAGPQRWGIAQVPHPEWSLHFKGGWGISDDRMPGTVNHQVALLRRGKQKVALVIMTQANASHEYGVETIEGVARALLKGLPGHPPGSAT